MTKDNFGQGYTYDPENRITGTGGFTYTYDADGNRVEKSNGSTGTLYWYMTPGIVAESDLLGNLQSEYVFFDSERIARKDFPSNAVSYYFSDHLKTADIVTDAFGTIKNESDYYPWGAELSFVANDSNHYKFTGKERDTETQLDYFGARYYSNGLGRFITPDWAAKATAVPHAEFSDPQSLNLYTYVRNIPTTRFDADGHEDNKKKLKPQPRPKPAPTPTPTPPPAPSPAPQPNPPILPPCQSCEDEKRAIFLEALRQALEALLSGPEKGINFPPVADNTVNPPPPLKIIHLEPPLQGSASYQDWNKKSTEEIIKSLAPDAKDPLTAYPDGAIALGNTRITILKERGVDVDNLPRVIHNRDPVPDPIEPK